MKLHLYLLLFWLAPVASLLKGGFVKQNDADMSLVDERGLASNDSSSKRKKKKKTLLRKVKKYKAKKKANAATSSPAPTPTKLPEMETQSPTDINTTGLEDFGGILNAFSIDQGTISMAWDGSLLLDSVFNVTFDVFVALGVFDFFNYSSVDDLIDIFQVDPSFQYHEVTDTDQMSIVTPFTGEIHTLLVTARKDSGEYSLNRKPSQIVASTMTPHMREEVTVIGPFIPTTRVDINLADSLEGVEHSLTFMGPVADEALSLNVGDIVTGFTSDLDSFIRRIVSITQSSQDGVIMSVVHARIDEIYDELDLHAIFDISRNQRQVSGDQRRLNIFKKFVKGIVNVGKGIGDAVTGLIDDVVGFVEEVFGGEVTEKFSIIDIDESWNFELASTNGTVSSTLNYTGHLDVEVALFCTIRVAGVLPIFAHVGATASYSFEAALELSAGVEAEYSETFDVWEGRRSSRNFFVGPVPFHVYAQPKLAVEIEAKASLEVSSKFGVSAKGGTEAGAIYDAGHNPVVRHLVVPPTFEPEIIFPTINGEASIGASAALVLSLNTGLDGGLLEASIALRGALETEAAAGIVTLGIADGAGITVLPTLNKFGLGFTFSIPFSAKALFGKIDLFQATVFQKEWPLIALPSIDITVLRDHRCLLGNGQAVASLSLKADESYPSNALIGNGFDGEGQWYLNDSINGWVVREKAGRELVLEKNGLESFSPEPIGTVTFAARPRIPPLPLEVIGTVSLQSLFSADGTQCTEAGPCDGDPFFDKLVQQVGTQFNSEIFLSQQADDSAPLVPSTEYKFDDFMASLKKLQGAGENFQFWLGDDCSEDSQKAAFVNMAAFLGQAMRETIIFDACDENNYDLWRADIFKEPTSPPENLPALYPMSSGCGQLGQKYADYDCEDACPLDPNMELNATTNAKWIGAPPPLFCGPKTKYDNDLGYWNPQQFCNGPSGTCVGEPFNYPGQTAGVHVPVSEDPRFPEFFYANPLPDSNGFTPAPRAPDAFPSTNVENCCWWGRGVIQTTGRCNFGKLNKQLGAGAGANALYPEINFCSNPNAICEGPSDLKWTAGIFFWVADPQKYDRDGFNYIAGVKQFVEMGCADDPDADGCDFLFEFASGIVNRGCHFPGESGCPGCIPGSTCGPAHNVPERVAASKQVLRALMSTVSATGTTTPTTTGGTARRTGMEATASTQMKATAPSSNTAEP